MTVSDVLFLAICLITLVAAWRVVVSAKVMHAALWLGLTFFGVAAVFLMLSADFVAAAQVLVYVSDHRAVDLRHHAVRGNRRHRGSERSSLGRKVARSAAAGFAALMVYLYHQAGLRQPPPAEVATDTPRAIGTLLFSDFVIPFEVASLVLLVGMVGAIVLAMREEG